MNSVDFCMSCCSDNLLNWWAAAAAVLLAMDYKSKSRVFICSVDSSEQGTAYTQYLSQMLNMAAGLDDNVSWLAALVTNLKK